MNLALALFLSVSLLTSLGFFLVYAHYFHVPKTKLTDDQSKRLDEVEKNINRIVTKVGLQPR